MKSENKGPPHFEDPLRNITIIIGSEIIYSLPRIVDPDKLDIGMVESI
jgi:hypothetical protein